MTNIIDATTDLTNIASARRYVVATDGACRGNPGPGGWGTRLYSKRDIAQASGMSLGQIGNMRVAARELGDAALDQPTWFLAQKAWKGTSRPAMNDDERDLWVQQQAERGAEGLRNKFGMWLAKHPEIAAQALAIYFGRKLPEVYRELRDHLAEEDCSFGEQDDFGIEDLEGVDY